MEHEKTTLSKDCLKEGFVYRPPIQNVEEMTPQQKAKYELAIKICENTHLIDLRDE
jgi:hypothetical protein